jgi:hypothetical protein
MFSAGPWLSLTRTQRIFCGISIEVDIVRVKAMGVRVSLVVVVVAALKNVICQP